MLAEASSKASGPLFAPLIHVLYHRKGTGTMATLMFQNHSRALVNPRNEPLYLCFEISCKGTKKMLMCEGKR
jgi:hypothetical protein